MANEQFEKLFKQATDLEHAYPYQEKLATDGDTASRLLTVPTGLGKTVATVLAWIWRRRFDANLRRHEFVQVGPASALPR